LVSLQEANAFIESLNYNPLHGLHQTSLNIQSLLEDGSKELRSYGSEEDGRDERMFKLILDVVDELPMSPQKDVVDSIKEIYRD
jgi:hypothetical protein